MSEAVFLAIGDNCLDVYSSHGVFAVGGNALNVAANWALHGHRSRYLGAVGNDLAGDAVIAALDSLGVDTGVRREEGHTGVTVIRLNDGDRELLYEEFGVGAAFDVAGEQLASELAAATWVHIAGVDPALGLVERSIAGGARVSVDLATSGRLDGFGGAEIAFASWTPSSDRTDLQIAEALLEAGAVVAVVTSGADGSLSMTDGIAHRMPAQSIVPVDTCGAGDSFISAYVASHVAGEPVESSLRIAAETATAVCLHLGGWEQPLIPIPNELRAHPSLAGLLDA